MVGNLIDLTRYNISVNKTDRMETVLSVIVKGGILIICYWDNCNPAISRITFNEFRGVSIPKENAFSIRRFIE